MGHTREVVHTGNQLLCAGMMINAALFVHRWQPDAPSTSDGSPWGSSGSGVGGYSWRLLYNSHSNLVRTTVTTENAVPIGHSGDLSNKRLSRQTNKIIAMRGYLVPS